MNLQVDPEVKAIFDEIVAHTPELGPLPSGDVIPLLDVSPAGRPWLAVAAATIALAGVGGVILLANRPADRAAGTTPPTASAAPAPTTAPPQTAPPTTAPTVPLPRTVAGAPALYPVLDEVPDGLEITAIESRVPAGGQSTEATVGRVADGTLTDAVTISVQTQPYMINPIVDHPPTATEVFGTPATVYDYGDLMHVTWGTGPYYLATGADPLAFLAEATPDAFHAEPPVQDAYPLLTFGALPTGYEVVSGPDAIGAEYSASTLSIGSDNYDVSVGPRDWVASAAIAGPMHRVTINGQPGWALGSPEDANIIAWQLDATTFAVLKVNDGSSESTALAIAEALAWVDRDDWTARYNPDATSPPNGTAPATTFGG